MFYVGESYSNALRLASVKADITVVLWRIRGWAMVFGLMTIVEGKVGVTSRLIVPDYVKFVLCRVWENIWRNIEMM